MDQKETLAEVLGEFARTMVTDFPIQKILDHLVLRIVDVLPVTSAGVTLISPALQPYHVAASDGSALRYERLQTEVREGPCIAAYETGTSVSIPDLTADEQFPHFAPRAVAAGLGAVFTFPLNHGDHRLGALDLYRQTPGALDDASLTMAQTLADVAAAYLVNAKSRDDAHDAANALRTTALHDPLTGLPNRVLLHERLEHAVLRARRSHGTIAVLFVDLDRFKQVNDTYGHRTGDELLVAVGERLTNLVRPGDTVARMSGDEFVMLCEDFVDPAPIETLAKRIVTAIAEPFDLSTAAVTVTATVGVAFRAPGDGPPDAVLSDADEAMYQAKRAGGGRQQRLDVRQRSQNRQRALLAHDLGGAAGRGELRVAYQPIVRTDTRAVAGVEALLRWDHPQHGAITPTVAIAVAEEANLIAELGRWVLERACTDRSRLPKAPHRSEVPLSVNVSPLQLLAGGFCSTVEEVLNATGTDPHLLTLEVTESVYLDDHERARVVLDELRQVGVRIALDDFGTGYSSLSYLQRLPIDVVKIDQSFIATLGAQDDPDAAALVGAVIDLAHALRKSVVAEGVETEAQHRELVALGCETAQGYLFAKPMCHDDVRSLLLAPV